MADHAETTPARKWARTGMCAGALCLLAGYARADEPMSVGDLQAALDTLWVMVAGFLVFFMNAGFALVESGFCRAKNTVNILAKNFIVFAIAALTFWATGFALMFGNGNGLAGVSGFFLSGDATTYSSLDWTCVPVYAKFFFQLAFAATAATIVSGAVAERIKFQAYILFAGLLVAVMYPVAGHWVWGNGFLANLPTPFHDFAGSTVVHSVGGWAALVGAWLLGPRIGKYSSEGVRAIPGHNIALATLGGLILWLGWFGFNPGSTMAVTEDIARISVTTALAASAGIAAATAYAWIRLGTPDLTMIVNGCLAGLVAITAPCWVVTPTGSILIGLIAGMLVVESVIVFDKLHIDDPVGAISVHLVNGVWGTVAVGLFAAQTDRPDGIVGLLYGGGATQLVAQLVGIVVVGAFTAAVSFGLWHLVRALVGLRVTRDEEFLGLDQSEMGLEAYPEDAASAAYAAAKTT